MCRKEIGITSSFQPPRNALITTRGDNSTRANQSMPERLELDVAVGNSPGNNALHRQKRTASTAISEIDSLDQC